MSHASLDRELTTAKGILTRAAQTEKELRALLSDAEAAGAGNKNVRQSRSYVDALEQDPGQPEPTSIVTLRHRTSQTCGRR